MTDPGPEFPESMMSDDPDINDFRAISEWLYINETTEEVRSLLRDYATRQRKWFNDRNVDPTDYATAEMLWHAWFVNSSNWQRFMLADAPFNDPEETVRALRWSGMILLLTTEDIPLPS